MKRFSCFILVGLALLFLSACSDERSVESNGDDRSPASETSPDAPEHTHEPSVDDTQEELDCGLYDDAVSVDEYAECINPGIVDATQEELDCGLYDDAVSIDEYVECMNPEDYIEPDSADESSIEDVCGLYDDSVSADEYAECILQ